MQRRFKPFFQVAKNFLHQILVKVDFRGAGFPLSIFSDAPYV